MIRNGLVFADLTTSNVIQYFTTSNVNQSNRNEQNETHKLRQTQLNETCAHFYRKEQGQKRHHQLRADEMEPEGCDWHSTASSQVESGGEGPDAAQHSILIECNVHRNRVTLNMITQLLNKRILIEK
jgi:hypothetical protein